MLLDTNLVSAFLRPDARSRLPKLHGFVTNVMSGAAASASLVGTVPPHRPQASQVQLRHGPPIETPRCFSRAPAEPA